MKYQTTLSTRKPIVITIGNFDGIHLGHQRLLQEARHLAQQLSAMPVLVTFKPHTLLVVRPDRELRLLTTLEEKLTLVQRYGGIDESIVIDFTPEIAAMTAAQFLDQLRTLFDLRGIVVGADFNLGYKRMGDTTFLKQYGLDHRIEVWAISLEEADDTRISSTRIRALVSQGEVASAASLLGHPVIVSGIVQHGNKRGRTLGFPTANLYPEPHKLLPADGVYAACVQVQNEQYRDSKSSSPVYNSVVNIGLRPTFGGTQRLIEVHLLDVSLDLYGHTLIVEFVERLRGEQRFPGIDALKAQIATDVQKAHQILTVRRVGH